MVLIFYYIEPLLHQANMFKIETTASLPSDRRDLCVKKLKNGIFFTMIHLQVFTKKSLLVNHDLVNVTSLWFSFFSWTDGLMTETSEFVMSVWFQENQVMWKFIEGDHTFLAAISHLAILSCIILKDSVVDTKVVADILFTAFCRLMQSGLQQSYKTTSIRVFVCFIPSIVQHKKKH